MNLHSYKGTFAGFELNLIFQFPDTSSYFGDYLTENTTDQSNYIYVDDKDYRLWEQKYKMQKDAYTEYCLSAYRVSDELIKNHSILFHGASFLWNKKAYIFSAPSGTGKSTQIRNWMYLYKDEITILNGDKSILKFCGNDIPDVYPSPWKGKERWGNDNINAPLGGIIFLRQGNDNRIDKISRKSFNEFYLSGVFSSFEDPDLISQICRIGEHLYQSVPMWILTNKGDYESARIMHDYICTYEG